MSAEQQARDMLEQMSSATYWDDPQYMSASDVVALANLFVDLEVVRRNLRERDELLEHLRDKLSEERALLRNTRELLREACSYLEATRTHSIFWFGWSHKAKAAGGDS